jgi:hypothetical protein
MLKKPIVMQLLPFGGEDRQRAQVDGCGNSNYRMINFVVCATKAFLVLTEEVRGKSQLSAPANI